MTGVIALESGLEELGEFLKDKGFQGIDWDGGALAADAVVYTGRKLESIYTSNLGQVTNVLEKTGPYDTRLRGDVETAPYGVLLVNAQGKTPQEVLEILKNRAYEHFI